MNVGEKVLIGVRSAQFVTAMQYIWNPAIAGQVF